RESGAFQILADFGEGERAAARSGDEHIEGEEGSHRRMRAAVLHENVANGDASAWNQSVKDLREKLAVLGSRILVDDGADPGQIGSARQGISHKIAGG